MSQGAYANPEHLRQFAGELWAFVQMIDEDANQMQARLARLHDSWRDQEYNHFADVFMGTRMLLSRFCEEAKKAVPVMRADADKLDNYLKTVLNR